VSPRAAGASGVPVPPEITEFLVHLEKERDVSPNTLHRVSA
jgi:hypothetical protein